MTRSIRRSTIQSTAGLCERVKAMNKLFSLDSRLALCADYVREGARLADIGTDHAYLPVWLAVSGRIKSAAACDVRQKPLQSGSENIDKYGCGNIVTTRLSDGLDEVSPAEADDIVLAGMGGELIVKIISRTEWLKDPDKHIIMQPMTKAFVLREYLCKNGFDIINEKACAFAGKNYSVMLAVYDGRRREYPCSFYYSGKLAADDPFAAEYIKQIIKKLSYKAQGRRHSGETDIPEYNIINELKEKFGVDIDDNG